MKRLYYYDDMLDEVKNAMKRGDRFAIELKNKAERLIDNLRILALSDCVVSF